MKLLITSAEAWPRIAKILGLDHIQNVREATVYIPPSGPVSVDLSVFAPGENEETEGK